MSSKKCTKCGKKISSKATFCQYCGNQADSAGSTQSSVREEKYVGSVHKCPSCGANITGFTAICPSCQHELNASIPSQVKVFTDEITKLDLMIVNKSITNPRGYRTWKASSKFWWVVLNFMTLCIPICIRGLLETKNLASERNLSPEEQIKYKYIQSYVFPNDRSTIMETIIYINTQVSMLKDADLSENSLVWAKIWKMKANELQNKAQALFPNDPIFIQHHLRVMQDIRHIETKQRTRIIIYSIVLLGIFIIVFIRDLQMN